MLLAWLKGQMGHTHTGKHTHTNTHTQVSLMLPGWFEGQMGTLCHYGGQATACGGSHIVIERTLSGSGVQKQTLNVVYYVKASVWSVY